MRKKNLFEEISQKCTHIEHEKKNLQLEIHSQKNEKDEIVERIEKLKEAQKENIASLAQEYEEKMKLKVREQEKSISNLGETLETQNNYIKAKNEDSDITVKVLTHVVDELEKIETDLSLCTKELNSINENRFETCSTILDCAQKKLDMFQVSENSVPILRLCARQCINILRDKMSLLNMLIFVRQNSGFDVQVAKKTREQLQKLTSQLYGKTEQLLEGEQLNESLLEQIENLNKSLKTSTVQYRALQAEVQKLRRRAATITGVDPEDYVTKKRASFRERNMNYQRNPPNPYHKTSPPSIIKRDPKNSQNKTPNRQILSRPMSIKPAVEIKKEKKSSTFSTRFGREKSTHGR